MLCGSSVARLDVDGMSSKIRVPLVSEKSVLTQPTHLSASERERDADACVLGQKPYGPLDILFSSLFSHFRIEFLSVLFKFKANKVQITSIFLRKSE
jgi:ABC-type thiamine transport system ATPase subunit